jgi:hypothetical protein
MELRSSLYSQMMLPERSRVRSRLGRLDAVAVAELVIGHLFSPPLPNMGHDYGTGYLLLSPRNITSTRSINPSRIRYLFRVDFLCKN